MSRDQAHWVVLIWGMGIGEPASDPRSASRFVAGICEAEPGRIPAPWLSGGSIARQRGGKDLSVQALQAASHCL